MNRRVDKDHIVPRSERLSDSLDSLVITFAEVNRMKGKRTAVKFVEDCGGQPVEGLGNVCVKPAVNFLKDVAGFETYKGHDDDKRRKRNRKRLLQLREYVEKEFTPRDLTQTSQLVRLGAQALERRYAEGKKPVITSLPGSVTGAVRKSWDVVGCLEAANPNVRDPATGAVRTKTEIRDITHLHHALDACVLALAAQFLPGQGRDGSAWQLLVKRRLTADEQTRARQLFGNYVQFGQDGQLRLIDLPVSLKKQLRERLAERRVVQHVPAEMAGMRAELNAWRVVTPPDEGGKVKLRQRIRQPDGSRPWKSREERASKLVGLQPGKLHDLKAALVIADNYGLALDPARDHPFSQGVGASAGAPAEKWRSARARDSQRDADKAFQHKAGWAAKRNLESLQCSSILENRSCESRSSWATKGRSDGLAGSRDQIAGCGEC